MVTRVRLYKGWITNLKELCAIRRVKRNRPSCTSDSGTHSFVEYWSINRKKCHDCGYKEDLVIKE